MKIRNGFVSNSSSSSFVLITKEDVNMDEFKKDGETEFIAIHGDDDTNYRRNDIMILDTFPEKLKYLVIMYAYCITKYNPNDANIYAIETSKMEEKLQRICEKYGYSPLIYFPRLACCVSGTKEEPTPEFYIGSDIETYSELKIAELMENEDTHLLEVFLFHPHSFCLLGGDEYGETYNLIEKKKKEVDYPYMVISDIGDPFEDGLSYNNQE